MAAGIYDVSGRRWFDEFVACGPDYPAIRLSASETQALLLKAAIGAGLPLGHAQDLSVLAPLLMSDPHLLGMAAAALEGLHEPPKIEGTDNHVVIEAAQVLMAGPLVIDTLVSGASHVILHNPDWPLLMWPYLYHAQKVYGLNVALHSGNGGTILIRATDRSELDSFSVPQATPVAVHDRLSKYAAKTYVPSSTVSRQSGAGAGMSDND